MKNLVNIVTISIAVGSLGYSIYAGVKMNKVYSVVKVNKLYSVAVDKISSGINVDIPDDMIREAAEKAIEREVSKVGRRVQEDATYKIKNSTDVLMVAAKANVISKIGKDIEKAIEKATDKLDNTVTDELKRQINSIDIEELKKEIKKEAKDKIIEKFENEMDVRLHDD